MTPTKEYSGAVFSECKMYRYELYRIWDTRKPCVLFLLHNPSTADEIKNDPTIRRCIGFAKSWGYGGMFVVNICPYRATNPKDLIGLEIPQNIKDGNDFYIKRAVEDKCDLSIAAYGNPINNEYLPLYSLHGTWYCFGTTKEGNPKHPLYLPKNQPLVEFTPSFKDKVLTGANL